MAILTATNVGQSFGDYDVFSGVSASIPRDGKVGLVGANGIGKTTLLLILAGLRPASAGSVHLARDARIGYLSQESSDAFIGVDHSIHDEMLTVFAELRQSEAVLREMEAAMAAGDTSDELLETYSKRQEAFELAGGYDYELRIQQVLTGLGFERESWDQPLTQLSGGQKTRVLLGRLLLEAPDLLILDEPTNHLDVAAIQWLENTLANWPGAVLVVSHDRFFLDRVVGTIWEMRQNGLEIYRGNYSAYLQQRQDRWERLQREYDAMQERLAKELDFIKKNIAGQRTQMAQGKLSRVGREVEAIRVGGLRIIGDLNSKGWLQVSSELDLKRPPSTVSELEAAIKALPSPTRPPVLNVRLDPAYRSGNIVLRAADLEVGYPGHPLFTVEALELHRLETAALIGPNGAGKTTFLRTVLGELEPLSGTVELGASLSVGYFAQVHESLRPENTVLDEFLRHRAMPISEARNHLARFLFRGDDVYSQVSTLSGGEKARLALSILVLENANFLLLDEPTNHLDIPSQEVLQAALEAFDGTILLVSHDRYLVDRLASQIWDLVPDGEGEMEFTVFNGTYQGYLAAQAGAEAETAVAVAAEPGQQAASTNGSGLSKNEQRKRQQALDEAEHAIHETEQTITRLGEALQEAAASQAYERVQELTLAYQKAEEQLEALLKAWEELAHGAPDYHRVDG